ncbi:MAG: decarboxylating 6-phosphogluconate dehydrogenase [Thiobacillaceae bacterium]|nr:decarboxylating 6-phosphogluconate dehydrogenase [Hydrogenophilales bacterium]MBP8901308.1 decarboxylating 6-phosphogluconate dehydrogenase [Thiobacillaceae bacterium]MBP9915631.1 decarboxylating 6-phosphogluconate dehydrogenase [Thiobacillaceae bacterium]
MEIGLYGLGRMGGNMARRLARGGVRVHALNRSFEVADKLAGEEPNVVAHRAAREMVAGLAAPRVVWLMLPAGAATDGAIRELSALLAPGDLLVDGANGFYQDAMRRSGELEAAGIRFADVGVSGGVWGLANGYCLMAGGSDHDMTRLIPFLKVLAPTPDTGWLHAGPVGAGHFTKMVHNGIEYGMMQALAEGFALLGAKKAFDLDLAAISELWRHSSVVRSWLLDLTADFLKNDQSLEGIAPQVADSGEGRWTALEAINLGVPTPVMTLALMSRFASQGQGDFANRMLAMMRKGFGGHAVKEGAGETTPPFHKGGLGGI